LTSTQVGHGWRSVLILPQAMQGVGLKRISLDVSSASAELFDLAFNLELVVLAFTD
jgi:hypothetical protein